MPASPELLHYLETIAGKHAVLSRTADLLNYESDGTINRKIPLAVVLPQNAQQIAAIVKLAHKENISIVARGAGTGLAGGAVSTRAGIIISTARMNRILQIDYKNRLAIVEPGVVNLDLSLAVADQGYFYAPDPSSQRACTIGGNVATNSGGPHCLSYGVTSNHIIGLEFVSPSGEIIEIGGHGLDPQGYDLPGIITGSEGTIGIVTKITVRLVRKPEAVRVMLGIFPGMQEASHTVSSIIARGILPSALEMMDATTCQAVEAAYHLGFPPGTSVLLIETDGIIDGIDEINLQIESICKQHGAKEIRKAQNAAECAALWNARKTAFGAMGRLAPNYYLQDGVVPRSRLPDTLKRVEHIGHHYQIPIANVFHAGDGNLHPILLFDRTKPGATERVLEAADEILRACIDAGGAVSGEHGIGIEKRKALTLMFTPDDLRAMANLKRAFNPRDLFNPDKILPEPGRCGEIQTIKLQSIPAGPHSQ